MTDTFIGVTGLNELFRLKNESPGNLVYPARFELTTFGSASQRSIQLSYGYKFFYSFCNEQRTE